MTAVQPTGTWTGQEFAHEGFVFSDDDEVVGRCVPFAREGFDRDEQVLVVAGDGVRQLLGDALGADVAKLASLTRAEGWWHGGHGTLHAYDRDLQELQASGRPWRLIAEPVWLARDDGREWSRFEAVTNRCYPAMRYYSLCLHDRRRLPPDVIDAARRTHPLVWTGQRPEPSPWYEDTAEFLRHTEPAWSAPPPDATAATVTDARTARSLVAAAARREVPGREDDVVLAVHELVLNALRAGGRARVSTWTSNGHQVFEVADTGAGLHDPTAGYVPPSIDLTTGRGLWLARSLADDATLRADDTGTAVRLFFRR